MAALLAALLVSTATAAGGCSAEGSGTARRSGQAHDGSVTIAVEGPMTGPQASTGLDILHGVQLALTQGESPLAPADPAGASTQAHGTTRINTVVVNDADSASRGVRAARKAVAQHLDAVIGPYDPSVARAVIPVYKKAHVAVLSLSPGSSFAGYGASVVPTYLQDATVEAQELVEVLDATSVAIVYDPRYPPTSEVASSLRSLLVSSGVDVPLFGALVPGESVSSMLSQVAAAGADDWYLAMPGSQTESLSRGGASAGVPGTCLVDLLAGSGPYSSSCLAAGVPDVAQMPGGLAYSSAYATRYHREPGPWGAFAYDSTRLLIAAARLAGTWSFGPVTSALAHVSGLSGVTGDITIEPSTATRLDAPVVVVDESPTGGTSIDPAWAAYSSYESGSDASGVG